MFYGILKRLFIFILIEVQGLRVYRIIARLLRTGIVEKEADEEEVKQALHWMIADQIERTIDKNNNITSFVAKKGGQIIGYIELVRRPEQYFPYNGYWIHSLIVKTVYRRMGIGEGLSLMTIEKSQKEGAKELSLIIFEDNRRAMNLYLKLGFKRKVIPVLERQLENEQGALGHREICMSTDLG